MANIVFMLYGVIFLLVQGMFAETYCTEGEVMINCSYNIDLQNNTKLDLVIKKNGSEIKRTKALPSEKNIYKLKFKFEDNQCTTNSLNYTCVWINPKNTLVLYKKNVNVKCEDLPKPPQNLMMKFIYTPLAFNWHLKVSFTKTGSSNATKYTISGHYGTGRCHEYNIDNKPCPGTCDVFTGEIFSRHCYVVNVYATSSTGMCSTPLRKLVSLAEIYRGFRNFIVRVIDKKPVRVAVSWQNPRSCCDVDFTTDVKTYIEICGAGKCENRTFKFNKDSLQYDIQSLAPYTKYRTRMTVEWSSYREFAPWTPTVEIRTPSEVPPGLPQNPNCSFDSTGTGIKLSWKPPPAFKGKVNKYILKLEQTNHTDTTTEANSSVCHLDVCSYTFTKIHSVKQYRLSIRTCSDGGCVEDNKLQFCDLTGSPGTKVNQPKDNESAQKYIVYSISGLSALVVILLIASMTYFVLRKRRSQPGPIRVVEPRLQGEYYSEPHPKLPMYDMLQDNLNNSTSSLSGSQTTTSESSHVATTRSSEDALQKLFDISLSGIYVKHQKDVVGDSQESPGYLRIKHIVNLDIPNDIDSR